MSAPINDSDFYCYSAGCIRCASRTANVIVIVFMMASAYLYSLWSEMA